VFKRFRTSVKADAFYRMVSILAEDADFEHAMIDGIIVKVHRHGQGANELGQVRKLLEYRVRGEPAERLTSWCRPSRIRRRAPF
jgi:hypothetical protein